MTALLERLRAIRNPDGGWPYYPGKTSRLEPTCWALLALQAAGEKVSLDVLRQWPRREGWFVDRSSDAVNVAFNGLAAFTLAALSAEPQLSSPVARALVSFKGEKYPQSPHYRQNNSLQGWSWVSGTFSWIEPTAWAVLALKKLRVSEARARIDEAERLFADRVCKGGGWNFGNSNVLGQELGPYVPTTALTLLSMSDRADTPYVRSSVEYLWNHHLDERSGSALGLSAIALGVYGRNTKGTAEALLHEWTRTTFVANSCTLAIVCCAMTEPHEVFRL
jgi:hypothetical protein